MSEPDGIEVCSYRTVFDLERRVYRIDRLRLNPGGVPLRGIAYGLAAMLGMLALGALPVLRVALAPFPWYVRDLALPAALAAVAAMIRIEGRPFHHACLALVRHALGPRTLSGLRPCGWRGAQGPWLPPELLLLPDGSDAYARRLRFRGAGVALVAVAHECERRPGARLRGSPGLVVRALRGRARPSRGRVVELAAGACLEVR
jgi:hypothetical protein